MFLGVLLDTTTLIAKIYRYKCRFANVCIFSWWKSIVKWNNFSRVDFFYINVIFPIVMITIKKGLDTSSKNLLIECLHPYRRDRVKFTCKMIKSFKKSNWFKWERNYNDATFYCYQILYLPIHANFQGYVKTIIKMKVISFWLIVNESD